VRQRGAGGTGEEHCLRDFRNVKASARAWGGRGRRVLWCHAQARSEEAAGSYPLACIGIAHSIPHPTAYLSGRLWIPIR
jgi:hypothetical protein